jgi:chitinase
VLSVTIAAWQKLPAKAFDVVDWVNLMAYDHPGRHSTFESAQSDVKKLIDAGVPARKLTLGLPFYGRDTKKSNRVLTYREIVAKYRPEPTVDEIDNFYFNGPETISRKTKYAIDTRLAGVMVWELGQDAAGDQSLLKVIKGVVDQSAHK